MRAAQVVRLQGPSGVEIREVPDPTPGDGEVLVGVHAAGVAFPDLLLSKGEYQLRPEPPFTLGVDLAGRVVGTGSGVDHVAVGDRVAAVVPYGAAAELVVVPSDSVLPLPDSVAFDVAAALPLNYLTAHFALAVRGQLVAAETVLVHGAAGGVGTATIQVAKALGARTIAVVSTPEKAEVATRVGADEVVLLDEFKDAVAELTEGRGVDVVLDVVGGDAFTDSLRLLAPLGRLLVVGFAAGQGIPEVKVNRLLLNNIDVRGVGWGGYTLGRPGYLRAQWAELLPRIEQGLLDPPIGATYPLEDFGLALTGLENRSASGKTVIQISPGADRHYRETKGQDQHTR